MEAQFTARPRDMHRLKQGGGQARTEPGLIASALLVIAPGFAKKSAVARASRRAAALPGQHAGEIQLLNDLPIIMRGSGDHPDGSW